jgi:Icc-related predicted phosphoesterase
LIYFIFRDDTYVVSFVFACLMIIGELAARVRILLEKGPSRYHISKDQQFQEKIQKFIFYQMTKLAKRRERGKQPGAHTTRWRGPGPGRAT